MKFINLLLCVLIFSQSKSQEKTATYISSASGMSKSDWKMEMAGALPTGLNIPILADIDVEVETELATAFKKINEYHERQKSMQQSNMGDSLAKANEYFQKLLLRHAENPLTLNADLAGLKKLGVRIATSDDRLFRIYSWNTEMGGSMRIFRNVYQYKYGDKIYSKAVPAAMSIAGSWYSEIYSHQASGKTYYLGIGHSILSGVDNRQEIRAFEISGGALNDAKLIKTREGLTNRLRVLFDFFSVSKRTERPVKLIVYDKATQEIRLPLVDAKYQVTDKAITYKFDGSHFVRK